MIGRFSGVFSKHLGNTNVPIAGERTRNKSVQTSEKQLTPASISISYYVIPIDGAYNMQAVTVSPKFQVVIPRSVRDSMQLRAGQKMQVIEYDGRIEMIPQRDIKDLRGFVKDINTEFQREKDRI